MTVKQAAATLGISAALVYALVARRKIRHERHGLGRGSIRIPQDAIDDYRRSVTVETKAGGGPEQPRPAPRRKRPALKHITL